MPLEMSFFLGCFNFQAAFFPVSSFVVLFFVSVMTSSGNHNLQDFDEEPLVVRSRSNASDEDPLESLSDEIPSVDVSREYFPFSIVWTSLPLMTWLAPPVGHLGITMSEGLIHDFAGPYFINV